MGNLCPCFKSKNNQPLKGESEKLKTAIKILKREKYKYKSKLGVGTFGDVIEVCTLDKKRCKFAAKIVSSKDCSHVELELWRSFHHDNVLPLLEILQESDINIFLMPLHKLTMMQAIEEDSFLKETESFIVTKHWLSDVLQGLEYLHDRNICHADLKINNVLITDKRSAVLCDFSYSCLMTGNITQYGLPWFFRPPEAFFYDDVSNPVNGENFDLWSFGMMALYTWTRIYSGEMISTIEYWKKFTYTVLFDYLQLPKFNELVKEVFPNAEITPEEISLALNLIQGVLLYEAAKRPRASVILQHPLLHKEARIENLLEVSSIWTYRHSYLPNELENANSDMDERIAGTEIETCIQDFTKIDTFISNSSKNKTNESDKNTFDLSLSSEISSSTMRSGGTESYFDKPLNVDIMENNESNRENTDVKIPVVMEHPEDHFKESLNTKDMQDLSNDEVRNKNLSSKRNVKSTSDFCQSHLHYIGYSLLHELLMTL